MISIRRDEGFILIYTVLFLIVAIGEGSSTFIKEGIRNLICVPFFFLSLYLSS